jgi:hypothetical protein
MDAGADVLPDTLTAGFVCGSLFYWPDVAGILLLEGGSGWRVSRSCLVI